MRKTYLLTVGLIWALVQSLVGDEVFEGQYDMAFSGDGDEVVVSCWVKAGHMRMKVGGKGGVGEMIMRDGMSSMLMIMPQQRMYMEMPVPVDTFDTDEPELKDGENPFKKTGKTKKMLGLTVHEFLFDHEGEKMTIWATDELGSMPYANNPMLQGWAIAMRKLTGLKSFFPIETIGTENGKESFKMTVKKVEKKSLPDSMFLPPEGFMKMTIPAGMGGFMPGG